MGLQISISWDPSVSSAPSGLPRGSWQRWGGLKSLFSDPVTVNIDVG